MSFSEIVGQDKAISYLKAILSTKRLPNALMFYGPSGVGKFKAALEFTAALNCSKTPYKETVHKTKIDNSGDLFASMDNNEDKNKVNENTRTVEKLEIPDDEACGRCISCLQIQKGVHPDVVITDLKSQMLKDGKETLSLKIDTMRDMIQRVSQKPMLSEHKVFIIRDAEALVIEAQNSILKTLEEPPDGTILILIVSDKTALLPTILSRVCSIEFTPLPTRILKTLLEKEGFSTQEASGIAKNSHGSIDAAKNFKKFLDRTSDIDFKNKNSIFEFTSHLPKESFKAREEVNVILELLITSLRDIWAKTPGKESVYAKLLEEIMQLRSMTNRNVSSERILESALLSCQSQGITLDKIFGE